MMSEPRSAATVRHPTDPGKLYFRCMFHTFFWGPFDDEQAVVDAMAALDATDPMWDDNPWTLVRGMNPLPTDYVYGFPHEADMQQRILAGRREG